MPEARILSKGELLEIKERQRRRKTKTMEDRFAEIEEELSPEERETTRQTIATLRELKEMGFL